MNETDDDRADEPVEEQKAVEEPKDRLTWTLVWVMGIIGAIVLIVWTGMLLFIH